MQALQRAARYCNTIASAAEEMASMLTAPVITPTPSCWMPATAGMLVLDETAC